MARRANELRAVETSFSDADAAASDGKGGMIAEPTTATTSVSRSSPAMALTPRRGKAAKERRSPSAFRPMVVEVPNGDAETKEGTEILPSSSSSSNGGGSPSKAARPLPAAGRRRRILAKLLTCRHPPRCCFVCRPLRPFLCRALGLALLAYVALFLRGHTLLEEYHLRFRGYYESNIPGRSGSWRTGGQSAADIRTYDRAAERKARERRERTRPPLRRSVSGKDGGAHLKRYRLSVVDEERRGMPPKVRGPSSPRTQRRRLDDAAGKGDDNGDDFSEEDDDRDESEAPPVSNAGGEEEDKGNPKSTEKARANNNADKGDDDKDGEDALAQLCGKHARAATASDPYSFPSRDALTPDSRVLISGILTPLGMHLALTLYRQCGVKRIVGIDPMLPNTVPSRLEYLARIKALHRELGDALILPVVVPFVGLDPPLPEKGVARSKQLAKGLRGTWEIDLMRLSTSELGGAPTHVVHVAGAYVDSYRDVTGRSDGTLNVESPYMGKPRAGVADGSTGVGAGAEEVGRERIPPLLKIRQSSAAMEHILMSLRNVADSERRPHFVYASSEDVARRRKDEATGDKDKEKEDDFHGTVKTIEEVLSATYGQADGRARDDDGACYSVGLRLPRVYGPWGMRELNPEHDLVELLLTGTNATEVTTASASNTFGVGHDDGRSLLFVDDAVDAFVAAMQYRPESSEPAVFDVSADINDGANSWPVLGDIIAGHFTGRTKSRSLGEAAAAAPPKSAARPSRSRAQSRLGFVPETSLTDGAVELLSWHARSLPAVRTPSATRREVNPVMGEKLRELLSKGETTRQRGLGEPVYPCASECSSSAEYGAQTSSSSCTASVLDGVAALTTELTDGCGVVLYTTSLAANGSDGDRDGVGGVPFEAEYHVEGGGGDRRYPTVCNVAFVRRDGALVRGLMDNLPLGASKEAKAESSAGGDGKAVGPEQKLDALNGRLVHRGWILVWVPPPPHPNSSEENGDSSQDEEERAIKEATSLFKISPGALFAPTVKFAIFADGMAEDTPATLEEVIFLLGLSGRKEAKKQVADRKGTDGKVHRLKFPSERRRYASVLASEISGDPARARKSLKDALLQVLQGKSAKDASPAVVKSVKRQREMYSSSSSLLNRKDLRSPYTARYHLEYAHWINSSWLAHDLSHPESRLLRCDWLREDLLWGNGLEQMSFAHVMALRELERRMLRYEPDDDDRERMNGKLTAVERTRKAMVESLTDWDEWHPIIAGGERAAEDQCGRVSLPEKIQKISQMHPPAGEVVDSTAKKGKCQDHFVRLTSAKLIHFLRKKWREKKKDFPSKQSGDFYRGSKLIFSV